MKNEERKEWTETETDSGMQRRIDIDEDREIWRKIATKKRNESRVEKLEISGKRWKEMKKVEDRQREIIQTKRIRKRYKYKES